MKGAVNMQWELNTDKPVYLQLMEYIKADIITGVYKPGDKLPSVRELAAQATVNPNTMQRAFAELERRDWFILTVPPADLLLLMKN